jgi:hypothetical protein
MTPEEAGFRRTLRIQGRTLKVMSGDLAGTTFRATVNRVGEFELTTSVGSDPRGKRFMEFLAEGGPQFQKNVHVKDDGNGERFEVVAQEFDCPSYVRRFALKQEVPGKDYK